MSGVRDYNRRFDDSSVGQSDPTDFRLALGQYLINCAFSLDVDTSLKSELLKVLAD